MGDVTWMDFIVVILTLLIIIICVYIIIILVNASRSIKIIKNILHKNEQEIDSTLKNIPQLSENLVNVSGTLGRELKTVENTLDNINETSQMTVDTVKTFKNNILGKTKSVIELIDFIKKLFVDKKDQEDSDEEETDESFMNVDS